MISNRSDIYTYTELREGGGRRVVLSVVVSKNAASTYTCKSVTSKNLKCKVFDGSSFAVAKARSCPLSEKHYRSSPLLSSRCSYVGKMRSSLFCQGWVT